LEKKDFKNKWENYWYYYKIHTFAGIFALIVAVVTIRDCAARVTPDLGVMFVTQTAAVPQEIDWNAETEAFLADANGDGKKELLAQTLVLPTEAQSEQDMMLAQKVDLEFAAGDTTLFIFDRACLESYATRDAFEPLGAFLDVSRLPAEDVFTNESGTPVAVSLKNSERAKALGVKADDLYAAFIFVRAEYRDKQTNGLLAVDEKNSKKTNKKLTEFQNAKAFLEFLLDKEA
jgi:hypothetical protein